MFRFDRLFKEFLSKAATETVQKVWGTEYWLVNNKSICVKILDVTPLGFSSIHAHREKREFFHLLRGDIFIYTPSAYGLIQAVVDPQMFHCFGSFCGGTLLEVSTFHKETDVVRICPSVRCETKGELNAIIRDIPKYFGTALEYQSVQEFFENASLV